jgi:hypothetical protein
MRCGNPYGSEHWTMRIANMLELEFTLHPRGRPRRESIESHQKRFASPFLFFLWSVVSSYQLVELVAELALQVFDVVVAGVEVSEINELLFEFQ